MTDNRSDAEPRQIACERCHGQKLRCTRRPSLSDCVRCTRLGADCITRQPRPMGRRKASHNLKRSALSKSSSLDEIATKVSPEPYWSAVALPPPKRTWNQSSFNPDLNEINLYDVDFGGDEYGMLDFSSSGLGYNEPFTLDISRSFENNTTLGKTDSDSCLPKDRCTPAKQGYDPISNPYASEVHMTVSPFVPLDSLYNTNTEAVDVQQHCINPYVWSSQMQTCRQLVCNFYINLSCDAYTVGWGSHFEDATFPFDTLLSSSRLTPDLRCSTSTSSRNSPSIETFSLNGMEITFIKRLFGASQHFITLLQRLRNLSFQSDTINKQPDACKDLSLVMLVFTCCLQLLPSYERLVEVLEKYTRDNELPESTMRIVITIQLALHLMDGIESAIGDYYIIQASEANNIFPTNGLTNSTFETAIEASLRDVRIKVSELRTLFKQIERSVE